jgi:hypothetical protein
MQFEGRDLRKWDIILSFPWDIPCQVYAISYMQRPDVKNSSNKGIAKKEIVEDEKAVK